MDKKNETILIRLDKKTKDKFKLYCESKRSTMTEVLIEQVKKVLTEEQFSDKNFEARLIKKESDFLKTTLEEYKETYEIITKTLVSLDRNYTYNSDKMYCNLFAQYFQNIVEFKDYELSNYEQRNNWPDFIAINKKTGHKLCIEIRHNFNYHNKKSKDYYILNKCEQYGNYKEVQIVLISIEPINDKFCKMIENFSKRINYGIDLYCFEDLINVNY